MSAPQAVGPPPGFLKESTWQIIEGQKIAPGYYAWELLSVGKRFEVWAAWSMDRLTPVCIKIPRRDQFQDSTINALHREHDATARFDHPAIPRVFDADFATSVPYLVLEFIEGDPLGEFIYRYGPQKTDEVLNAGLQILAALRHIHRRGFVHHDMKPGNIMIRAERPVVVDFDLSLPIGVQRSKTKPRGTHSYMSPEQIRCAPASPSMDIFGLGAVLYRLASGVSPFGEDRPNQPGLLSVSTDEGTRHYRQLDGDLRPVAEAAPHLAASVAAAIDTMLTVDERQRPSTADEAISLLTDSTPPDDEGLWPDWVTRQVLKGQRPTGTRRARSQVEVITGADAAARYCADLATSQVRSAVFFDDQLQQTPAVAALLATLQTSSGVDLIPVTVGADNAAELVRTAERLSESRPDRIVSIGGGLTADVGRLSSLLAANDELRSRLVQPRPEGLVRVDDADLALAVPVTVISTTLGTGVEVSPVACFSHDGIKRLVASPKLQADVAILDPTMTQSLPPLQIEHGLIEAMLRYIGPLLAGPSTVPTADEQALTELAALRRLLLVARSGGLGADQRLEAAMRSANTRLGFALAGRDPYGAKLWYLATALTDLMPISKVDAHLLLLPTFLDRIVQGDTRFGLQSQLALVTKTALEPSAAAGAAGLVDCLGAPAESVDGLPAPDLVAAHCAATWGNGQPMLGMFQTDELQTVYDDGFSRHRQRTADRLASQIEQ